MFRAERAGGHTGRGQEGTQAEMTRVEWHRPEIGGAGARSPQSTRRGFIWGGGQNAEVCIYHLHLQPERTPLGVQNGAHAFNSTRGRGR